LIPSPNVGYRFQYSNSGYFAQEQLGFWDAVFVTAGLRAEDDQNFGKDFGLAWAPRAGVSYIRMFGNLTAKARVAYGKAIKPPSPGLAQPSVTKTVQQLGNPNLAPEQQVGPDGGLDLYFGSRGSVEATYYAQKVKDLIDYVLVNASSTPPTYQNQNVGRIKNEGWEFQGRLNVGRLSLSGTYSITSSTVQTLSSTYSGDLRLGDQMLAIPKHTAGATLSYILPRTTVNLGMTYVGSWTYYDYLALYGFFYGGQPYRGSQRAYWIPYASFSKFNLSVSHTVTDRLTAFLYSKNFTNNHVPEHDNLVLNAGRVTMIGVRTKL